MKYFNCMFSKMCVKFQEFLTPDKKINNYVVFVPITSEVTKITFLISCFWIS
ncbi:Hypothetical Protein SLY_0194 [Strawberry lethal yellows phytoplasma (CPA) str. NZSb11]|uniref:Uncharacterized protein n=1 Tax=Strawberry lethal yellows phytoplasma (CPA) str. NZSb11 TaxID=980422 RepID=R4RW88_PHYAS|nr:Hypothetical Protein SLY_0194 [Strawberry lethal yellows phytoplasma (CPA) str. NZSb11]